MSAIGGDIQIADFCPYQRVSVSLCRLAHHACCLFQGFSNKDCTHSQDPGSGEIIAMVTIVLLWLPQVFITCMVSTMVAMRRTGWTMERYCGPASDLF